MPKSMSGWLLSRKLQWRLVSVLTILLGMPLASSTAIAAGPTRFTTTANQGMNGAYPIMSGQAVLTGAYN